VLERVLDEVRPASGAYYDDVVFFHERPLSSGLL
jgi:hypothetical protein